MSESGPYELDPVFEKALVTLLCSKPRFFARIGRHLDPELLNIDTTKQALKAAQSIAADKGTGPSALIVIAQRMRLWLEDGKCTQEEIDEVQDMFMEAEDAGLPDEEDAMAGILPLLKRRLHDTAIHVAIESYSREGELQQAVDLITKSQQLGQTTDTLGVGLESAFDEIATISNLVRLKTGITELDTSIDGGPELGSSFVFVGGSGDGKSVALSQIAGSALTQGYNVAYATLEVSRPRTFARIMAGLTGVPINGILNGSRHEAADEFERIKEWHKKNDKTFGQIRVEEFTPNATTITDIKAWVHRMEEHFNIKFHVVIVDYLDRGTVEEAKKTRDSYTNMLHVFEDFRLWMFDEQRWGLTASQAKRRESKGKNGKRRLLDTEDGADSQNKVRVSDGWITLNVSPDGQEITFYIGKNRNGTARIPVGPLPTDWACGRIAPPNWPWDFENDDEFRAIDEELQGQFFPN